ncbi:MAG: hypothetical protein E2O44_07045 [Nitrospina sp.]|nr:MAG: hypothetical protein E2O44_07045 [Nitrospina sp.]
MFSHPPHQMFFASLAFTLLLSSPLSTLAKEQAPPSPLSVEAQIDIAEVTIGDIVTYQLSIRHDPEIQLATPQPENDFMGFIFIDQEILATQKTGGQVLEEFKFRFRADQVGHYTHSKIFIDFTVPNPEDPEKLIPGRALAPKTVVVVRSVLFLDGEPTDIRDIKSILGSAFDWRPWVLAIAGVIFIGLLIIYWFRNRGGKTPFITSAPELGPHEVALQELATLIAKNLTGAGRLREHYFELSEIFRRYLGARFLFPAPDWTAEEIARHLHAINFDPKQRDQVLSILQDTDHVKFAKAEVDAATSVADTHAVRQFIVATIPENFNEKNSSKLLSIKEISV